MTGDCCRICLGEEARTQPGDFLLRPCECDSMVHYACLFEWVATREYPEPNECEVCQGEYPHVVRASFPARVKRLSADELSRRMSHIANEYDSRTLHERNLKIIQLILIGLIYVLAATILLLICTSEPFIMVYCDLTEPRFIHRDVDKPLFGPSACMARMHQSGWLSVPKARSCDLQFWTEKEGWKDACW